MQQLGTREQLVLGELSAIHDLAALFAHTRIDTLQAFLTFHYLSSHAPYLPKRFDAARFAFYGQTMRGQPQQRERWKRAVDAVDDALGEAVGRLYVAQYFPRRIQGEDAAPGRGPARARSASASTHSSG